MCEKTEVKFNSREILESLEAGDTYLRRNFIGASDTPVILGISPWKTPYELWQEKCGMVAPMQSSFITDKGHEKEIGARNKFESLYGFEVKPKRLFSDEYDFMMASLDGYNAGIRAGVEMKFVGKESLAESYKGIIPEYYYPQLQKQMLVAEQDFWYYMAYIDDDQFMIIECKRDEEFIEKIIKEETKFWELVTTATPPEFTERDYHEKNSDEWEELSDQFKAVYWEMKRLEAKQKYLRDALILLSEGKNSKGFGIKLKKIVKKGNIDYEKIEELKCLDLEKYRKDESEYWKISIDD